MSDNSATRTHADVKADIQALLDSRDGHATTAEIYAGVPDAPQWQILKCIGWLGHITVPGKMYEHSTVWDHTRCPAAQIPPEDGWLRSMFDEIGADSLPSAALYTAATAQGFSRAAIDRALIRLQCPSKRVGGKWHRLKPGSVVSAEPAGKGADILRAAIEQDKPPAPTAAEITDYHYTNATLAVLSALRDNGGMLEIDWEAGYSEAELAAIKVVLPACAERGWTGQVAALTTLTPSGTQELARREAVASWSAGQTAP